MKEFERWRNRPHESSGNIETRSLVRQHSRKDNGSGYFGHNCPFASVSRNYVNCGQGVENRKFSKSARGQNQTCQEEHKTNCSCGSFDPLFDSTCCGSACGGFLTWIVWGAEATVTNWTISSSRRFRNARRPTRGVSLSDVECCYSVSQQEPGPPGPHLPSSSSDRSLVWRRVVAVRRHRWQWRWRCRQRCWRRHRRWRWRVRGRWIMHIVFILAYSVYTCVCVCCILSATCWICLVWDWLSSRRQRRRRDVSFFLLFFR